MRNGKRKTTYAQARDILERGQYGVLSCVCDDGLPYGVPLSYALSGNSLYFHCAPEGQKLDNLMHDSRASFTVVTLAENQGEALTMRYESVMAFGTVRIVYGEDERRAALELLCRKYAPTLDLSQGMDAVCQKTVHTAVLRMEVEYISGKCSDGHPRS
ncbi:MAG: pyridoxamine 5'-phosphate oxidase family protein [Clostridiales bacterium]|nr:pyridoxamine 5'-phosphate oxidase family protein [Clostridiales bacterium]